MSGPDPAQFWAALVPEMRVMDLTRSLAFYCGILGFSLRFERKEDGFAYIEMGQAQIMLEQIASDKRDWETGVLSPPFGRGLNIQIEVADAAVLRDRVQAGGHRLFRDLQEAWYRDGDIDHGQIEFLVQDHDGYLLRFVQITGTRAAQV